MDAVKEAQELYEDALEVLDEQRRQIEEDLDFSSPGNPKQWDDDELRAREADPGGARPCLVMDQLGQYISNVAGQIEQAPPALHALPVGDGADKRTAESLDGIFRHIEYSSRAQQHYARALTGAARAGVGYLVVRPDKVNAELRYFEPRIESVGDPLRVILDPDSEELDGSDASFAFITTPLTEREFEKRYPGKEKVSFGESDNRKREDKRTILIAEQFHLVDGKVIWRKLSGADVLAESEFLAYSVPIVPVYGYVSWEGGRMNYAGIARRARHPQKAYNFHVSEIRAFMAVAPKTPWIVPMRAVQGHEQLWDRMSVDARAWVPYNDMDEMGNPIAAPQRAQPSINLQNHMAGAEQALRDIQASIGMYQANLGAPSNETSGVAINERKQQGEASTAHFGTHLSASVARVGRIVLEMIPKLIDTRRQMRIIGMDDTPGRVVVDPEAPEAFADGDGVAVINPGIGTYDVRVVVGPAFSTQRAQAQVAYTEMMRANPAMSPAIAPLWAQTLDVPHADKLAQVLTAMAPGPVKAILQPHEEQQSTANLQAQVEQLSAALQEAIQHAEAAQQDADEAQAKLAEAEAKHEIEEDKVAVQAYDAQTKRLAAMSSAIPPEQVPALVQKTIAEMLDADSPWPGEQQPEQEVEEMPEKEPAGPSPEVQALAEQTRALAEGQAQLLQAVRELAATVGKPRTRIPIRDAAGNILQVIEAAQDAMNIQPVGGVQ